MLLGVKAKERTETVSAIFTSLAIYFTFAAKQQFHAHKTVQISEFKLFGAFLFPFASITAF